MRSIITLHSSSNVSFSVDFSGPDGARDNASAVTSCFPGTYMMLYLYRSSLSLNRRILGGKSSIGLLPSSDIRGLWSVCTVNSNPSKYALSRSHVHVVARASFSICAYRVSVGVRLLQIYTTGLHSPFFCFCMSTPPRP